MTKGTSKNLGIHAQTVGAVCEQYAKSRDKAKRSLRFRVSSGPRRSLGWIPFCAQSRQVFENVVTYRGKKFRWFGNDRRPLLDTARGGAFVEDARGRWYVCFHVDVADLPAGDGAVGIDLGLKALATMSDGGKVDATQPYRRHAPALATAQRAGNKRRVKAIHAKIANARKDHLHKATCRIARENRLVAVGNVNSSQQAKTRMAKSVFDAGWAMFRSQLRYKASRHGAVYLDIDERFTTQTCSGCGSIAGPKGRAGLNERRWMCGGCGASHDRDVNSAVNILHLALSAQRREDESRKEAHGG
jgi:IS605 OrfB family transposase